MKIEQEISYDAVYENVLCDIYDQPREVARPLRPCGLRQ